MAALARVEAPEIEPPALDLGHGEAQGGHGDRHLDDVARVGDAGRRVPDDVEAGVLAVDAGPHQVALDAVGIDEELVGPGRLPVGVQEESHRVVVLVLVALAHRRAQCRRVVVADEGRVEVVVVVGEQGLGPHQGRDVVAGLALAETVGAGGVAPARVVETAVDVDLPRGAGDRQGRLVDGREVRGGGGDGGDQEREQRAEARAGRDGRCGQGDRCHVSPRRVVCGALQCSGENEQRTAGGRGRRAGVPADPWGGSRPMNGDYGR